MANFYKGVDVSRVVNPKTGAVRFRVVVDGKPHHFPTWQKAHAYLDRWVKRQMTRDIKKNPAVKRHFER